MPDGDLGDIVHLRTCLVFWEAVTWIARLGPQPLAGARLPPFVVRNLVQSRQGTGQRRRAALGQSETNVTTEPWSAVEWIADADLTRHRSIGIGSTLPKSAQCVPRSRPSNSMLGLRQTTP
jgi:hypothetical protein